jgi:hypothetical protein
MFYTADRMRFKRRVKQFEIKCGIFYLLSTVNILVVESNIYSHNSVAFFANRVSQFERNCGYIFNSMRRRLMRYVFEYLMQSISSLYVH